MIQERSWWIPAFFMFGENRWVYWCVLFVAKHWIWSQILGSVKKGIIMMWPNKAMSICMWSSINTVKPQGIHQSRYWRAENFYRQVFISPYSRWWWSCCNNSSQKRFWILAVARATIPMPCSLGQNTVLVLILPKPQCKGQQNSIHG